MSESDRNLKESDQQEGVTFYWRNPNNQRYYTAIITQNLFGEWVIIKSWGGSKGGRTLILPCESFEAALLEIQRLDKYRKRRGYRL